VKEEESLHDQFIKKLEEKYGEWERITSTFGNSSFGKVAEDLCISSSQFTKLISGAATEGMYLRSIKNVEQLKKYDRVKKELKNLKKEKDRLSESFKEESLINNGSWKYSILFGIFGLVAGGFLFSKILPAFKADESPQTNLTSSNHPLSKFFEKDFQAAFHSPYLSDSEVQLNCPCSGFEGKWEIEKPYYFPLPGAKPGIYYLAKEADVRFKCSKIFDPKDKGKNLLGLGF